LLLQRRNDSFVGAPHTVNDTHVGFRLSGE